LPTWAETSACWRCCRLPASAVAQGYGGQVQTWAVLYQITNKSQEKNWPQRSQSSQRFNKKQPQMDADFADYTELLVGLGSLGLARLDVNIRQSQNLRPQAISTNGRQKFCKQAKKSW